LRIWKSKTNLNSVHQTNMTRTKIITHDWMKYYNLIWIVTSNFRWSHAQEMRVQYILRINFWHCPHERPLVFLGVFVFGFVFSSVNPIIEPPKVNSTHESRWERVGVKCKHGLACGRTANFPPRHCLWQLALVNPHQTGDKATV